MTGRRHLQAPLPVRSPVQFWRRTLLRPSVRSDRDSSRFRMTAPLRHGEAKGNAVKSMDRGSSVREQISPRNSVRFTSSRKGVGGGHSRRVSCRAGVRLPPRHTSLFRHVRKPRSTRGSCETCSMPIRRSDRKRIKRKPDALLASLLKRIFGNRARRS